jgi:hypothetical protein
LPEANRMLRGPSFRGPSAPFSRFKIRVDFLLFCVFQRNQATHPQPTRYDFCLSLRPTCLGPETRILEASLIFGDFFHLILAPEDFRTRKEPITPATAQTQPARHWGCIPWDPVPGPKSSPSVGFAQLRATGEQERNFHFFEPDFSRFGKLETSRVQTSCPGPNRR